MINLEHKLRMKQQNRAARAKRLKPRSSEPGSLTDKQKEAVNAIWDRYGTAMSRVIAVRLGLTRSLVRSHMLEALQ
jgi:hypothetical protein